MQYEILSLNPPLPMPPRTPVRVRKRIIADKRRYIAKMKKERKRLGLPEEAEAPVVPSMDRLVQNYLRRHEDRIKAGLSPTESRREEEYYSSLLLGANADEERETAREKQLKFTNPSSLTTAMGRKAMLVENAYAFALKQQQVMLDDDCSEDGKAMTERESVEKVEALLREESRKNRRRGHTTADDVEEWRAGQGDDDSGDAEEDGEDGKSLPSILHERPRAIRALNVWSARLRSIPYSRWTIGAATALDHWIAREVLQMDEPAWRQVLDGGGTDAYSEGMEDLPRGESRRGLMDRMRDIVVVRGALFPETLGEGAGADDDEASMGLRGDLDAGLDDESNATEKSINELLASLGSDEDDEFTFNFDDDEDDKKNEREEEKNVGAEEERLASIMDELQVWRQRNASSPYEAWDVDRKEEFDVSVHFPSRSSPPPVV